MLEQIGRFVGMAAADVVHFFRGRQAVPCTVDWDASPKLHAVTDECCGTCENGCWND